MISAPDKSNNPQEEFEMNAGSSENSNSTGQGSQKVVVQNIYDFKNVVAQAAGKGEQGLKIKKQNLIRFKANVSNKLEHIFNIAKNLTHDIKTFYEGPEFMVGNEPCLSEKMSVYLGPLQEIQDRCNDLNSVVDEDIKQTSQRLKATRNLQEQVNRDIMDFVQQKLKQFDNISVLGYNADEEN